MFAKGQTCKKSQVYLENKRTHTHTKQRDTTQEKTQNKTENKKSTKKKTLPHLPAASRSLLLLPPRGVRKRVPTAAAAAADVGYNAHGGRSQLVRERVRSAGQHLVLLVLVHQLLLGLLLLERRGGETSSLVVSVVVVGEAGSRSHCPLLLERVVGVHGRRGREGKQILPLLLLLRLG